MVQNRRFRSNGSPVDPKFQVEWVAPTNHSSSQKTRLHDLSHGIKITTDVSSVLSQCTRLTDIETDGQTDRILTARPRLHSMQRGKNWLKGKSGTFLIGTIIVPP